MEQLTLPLFSKLILLVSFGILRVPTENLNYICDLSVWLVGDLDVKYDLNLDTLSTMISNPALIFCAVFRWIHEIKWHLSWCWVRGFVPGQKLARL